MAPFSHRFFDFLMAIVDRMAWVIVVLSIGATVVAGAITVGNLGITTDTSEMISADVPFRVNNRLFNEAFPETKNVVAIVIDAPTPEDAENAADRLAEALTPYEDLLTDVYVPSADPYLQKNAFLLMGLDDLSSLSNRLAAAAPILGLLVSQPNLKGLADLIEASSGNQSFGTGDELADLYDKLAEVAETQTSGQALNLSWQALLAGGGAARLGAAPRRIVLAQPVFDYSKMKPAEDSLAQIRETAAAIGLGPENGVTVRLTGNPAINQDELARVEEAGIRSGFLSVGMIFVLLWIGLRSGPLVIATLATLLMGLAWTAAFAAMAVGHLNLISVAFAVLFVGLGVDFGIHFCLRYREEAIGGETASRALRLTAIGVGGALTLTAISAAAGFFSFLPTEYLGLAELGLISGVGMFVSLIGSVTTLPALLKVLPTPRPKSHGGFAFLSPSSKFGRRSVIATAIGAGAAGLALLPFVEFDANTLNLKDPNDESVGTFLDLAADPGTTPYTINVLVEPGEEERVLKERLRALAEVDRVVSLDSFVPKDQDDKFAILDEIALFVMPALNDNGGASILNDGELLASAEKIVAVLVESARRTDRTGEASARLETALAPLVKDPDGLSEFGRRATVFLPRAIERLATSLSAEPVALADVSDRILYRWQSADGRRRAEAFAAGGVVDNDALDKFAEAVLSVAPGATGTPITMIEAGASITGAFRDASILAFILIVAILLLALRNMMDAVFVLIPLSLAAVWTAGAAVILDLPFNYANIIVLPLLLGLGVSSGIHFVVRRHQVDAEAGLLASSTPQAVTFSAFTTIASFGSLALSGHLGMASMGQLLTIAIAFTLISTIFVLPALMAEVSNRGK
jgi:hypothetical protein